MKKLFLILLTFAVVACSSDADIASKNVSKAADNFEVLRRVIFYNGVTGEHILTIQGFCSLGNHDKSQQLSVTCKDNAGSYRKHFLGLSDNVTYFAEQIESSKVSKDNYRVVFNPSAIIPDIDIR